MAIGEHRDFYAVLKAFIIDHREQMVSNRRFKKVVKPRVLTEEFFKQLSQHSEVTEYILSKERLLNFMLKIYGFNIRKDLDSSEYFYVAEVSSIDVDNLEKSEYFRIKSFDTVIELIEEILEAAIKDTVTIDGTIKISDLKFLLTSWAYKQLGYRRFTKDVLNVVQGVVTKGVMKHWVKLFYTSFKYHLEYIKYLPKQGDRDGILLDMYKITDLGKVLSYPDCLVSLASNKTVRKPKTWA